MTARRAVVVSHTGLRSGAETVLLRAMEWLGDDGWDVELLAPAGPLCDAAGKLGITTRSIPELKLPALPRPLAVVVAAARGLVAGATLRRRAGDADLVLLNGLLGLPALWFARRARLRQPAAWIVHDVIRRRDWLALLRRVGPAADLAIAVSHATAEPLRGCGLTTTVVANGTGWPVTERPAGEGEPQRVGCAALLTPWKGQDVLLEAIAGIERDDVVVQLAGGSFPKDDEYVARLRARAGQPDLAGRVEFLGPVGDVLATMRSWDIAVSPSVDPEAGPLALLEYLSVGLPVVATMHGGTPEVLRGDDHSAGAVGVGVPPGDVPALRVAIETLLADPAERRRLGAAGRSLVERKYTLDHQQDAFVQVIEHLCRAARDQREQ